MNLRVRGDDFPVISRAYTAHIIRIVVIGSARSLEPRTSFAEVHHATHHPPIQTARLSRTNERKATTALFVVRASVRACVYRAVRAVA